MAFKPYRAESRANWGRDSSEANITNEEVKLGAILRIADAIETMAKSYNDMRNDRDYWKGRAERRDAEVKKLKSVIRGLRGALTRAKR